jgi:hypothetical protein
MVGLGAPAHAALHGPRCRSSSKPELCNEPAAARWARGFATEYLEGVLLGKRGRGPVPQYRDVQELRARRPIHQGASNGAGTTRDAGWAKPWVRRPCETADQPCRLVKTGDAQATELAKVSLACRPRRRASRIFLENLRNISKR